MSDTESSIITVWGYHGTSAEAAELILRDGFRMSSNKYDWLGDGVYFFQDAPLRAWEWANQRYEFPTIIRSSIRLEDCMDLVDIGWYSYISDRYKSFVDRLQQMNVPLPKQNLNRKAHGLDRAFFNYIVPVLATEGKIVRSIRAVFAEGERVFENSAIFDRAHIQIVIRDNSLIQQSCIIKPNRGI